jgi:hypothetical protein
MYLIFSFLKIPVPFTKIYEVPRYERKIDLDHAV